MKKIRIEKLDNSAKKDFVQLSKDCPKRHIDDYDVYGAYDGNNLIGGIVINSNPDNFHYKGLGLCPEIIIEFIFVLKEYRGKGMGKKLLKIALKYNSAGLKTGGMTSDIAKKMYKRAGFKVIKEKGITQYWYRGDGSKFKKCCGK